MLLPLLPYFLLDGAYPLGTFLQVIFVSHYFPFDLLDSLQAIGED